MTYKFNTKQPPLHSLGEHDGDILAIPPALLERSYGPARWDKEFYLGYQYKLCNKRLVSTVTMPLHSYEIGEAVTYVQSRLVFT